jgi:hypothetical protein
MEYVEFPTGNKILQWNYAQDLLLAGYIIVLEQVAKNMTQLLLNAITK